MAKTFTSDEIYTYLKILNKIVYTTPLYNEYAEMVLDNKRNVRSTFHYFHEDILPDFLLELESKPVIVKGPDGKVINESDALSVAIALITDFSVISALTHEEWVSLAIYLYEKNLRTIDPRTYYKKLLFTEDNTPVILIMLEHPWLIGLLLLELMSITQEVIE